MALTTEEQLELQELEELERLEAKFATETMAPSAANGLLGAGLRGASAIPSAASSALRTAKSVGIGAAKGFMRKGEPTKGAAEAIGGFIGRYGPQVAGATALGAMAAGPPGAAAGLGRGLVVAGAEGLGAGGAELAAQLAARGLGGPKVDAGEAGRAGALGAIGAGVVKGVGAAGRFAAPFVVPKIKETGAALLRAFPNIKMGRGAHVLDDLSILFRGQEPEVISEAYEAFERVNNLASPVAIAARNPGKLKKFTFNNLFEMMNDTVRKVNRVRSGEPGAVMPSKQELYFASRVSNTLERAMEGASGAGPSEAAKQGLALGIKGTVEQAGKIVDDALEASLPEYQFLRKAAAESQTRRAFNPLLPQNADFSPNVLRTGAAIAAATKGLSKGNVAPVGFLGAISPLAVGGALRAAHLASRAASSTNALDFLRRVLAARMADGKNK